MDELLTALNADRFWDNFTVHDAKVEGDKIIVLTRNDQILELTVKILSREERPRY